METKLLTPRVRHLGSTSAKLNPGKADNRKVGGPGGS